MWAAPRPAAHIHHCGALEEAVALARRLVEEGQAPTAACKEAARQTGHRKSQIYTALQEGR